MARQTIATIRQQHGNRLKALGQGANLRSPTYRFSGDFPNRLSGNVRLVRVPVFASWRCTFWFLPCLSGPAQIQHHWIILGHTHRHFKVARIVFSEVGIDAREFGAQLVVAIKQSFADQNMIKRFGVAVANY